VQIRDGLIEKLGRIVCFVLSLVLLGALMHGNWDGDTGYALDKQAAAHVVVFVPCILEVC
jgi:hypothetical protein